MNCVDLYEHFNKQFEFKSNHLAELPTDVYSATKWRIPELEVMKQELNGVKSQLNVFKLSEWSKHTTFRDPSALVRNFVKHNSQAELATQAWCKFYECLSKFHLIPDECVNDEVFSSLHLCEAPGAFVCALNHYIFSHYENLQWHWKANSLNPYHEGNNTVQMIPDDRLVKHTLDHWYFGLDGTGDITKYYNYQHITEKVKENGKIWLVTADGSVNCMDDPGEQEEKVAYLHYCETMTALSVLHENGNFVLKIFTIFEEPMISLLYLLNCLFKRIVAYKPSPSKSGNSEVYLLCMSFSGADKLTNIWKKLLIPYKRGGPSENSMFDLCQLDEDFLCEVTSCGRYFMEKQIHTISNNIKYFKNQDNAERESIRRIKKVVAIRYLRLCHIKRMPIGRRVVPFVEISSFWRGSEETFYIRKYACDSIIFVPETVERYYKFSGERIDKVCYSKFCNPHYFECFDNLFSSKPMLSLYKEILKHFNDESVVINMNDFNKTAFSEFQKQLYFKIKSYVGKKNIVLIGIPFITHFLVSLLFMLCSSFEYIYVHSGGCVILSGFKNRESLLESLNHVDHAYKSLETDLQFTCDIINVINPILLCDNDFYDLVYNYNNILFQSKAVCETKAACESSM